MRLKVIVLFFFFFCLGLQLFSQYPTNLNADSLFSTYYHQKRSLFKILPSQNHPVIFLGNSITEGGQWTELFQDLNILDRGISGDISVGIIYRLEEVYNRKPSKIFLLIGINDLARGISSDSLVKNILYISNIIHENSPETKLFVQSIFPVNPNFKKFNTHVAKQKEIDIVNKKLLDSAYSNYYEFLNIGNYFKDISGNLDSAYTNDGLHLMAKGYLKWKDLIYNKVYDLPSLIPQPKSIQWQNSSFLLNECDGILIGSNRLKNEGYLLQLFLKNKGNNIPIIKNYSQLKKQILIYLDSNLIKNEYSYSLEVTSKKIILTGVNEEAVYNAIQTLLQLSLENRIQSCTIYDKPAFEWRGYMLDVGRNYQSVQQIKEQIEIMSNYKLNRLHLHLTEDVAWRIQSIRYPQLLSRDNMLRNKGKYYTYNDINEINNYCKDRHILLIIEIDMPGHSAAFTRAFGFDMQSEKGKIACKNILSEFCDNIKNEYFHIGGDEVIYKDSSFLKEMISFLRFRGKKVIAWDPGGKVPIGTILQMWNGNSKVKDGFPAIDSRHLYLNHFDPFEGVVSVFNHIINDIQLGDSIRLGATLCNWPDRKVSNEKDLIKMNGVYPIMLTFSERVWSGGGTANYKSDFNLPGSPLFNDFSEFESRLLNHKKLYFNDKPFPYFKQTNLKWELIGPYFNNGNTLKKFPPELDLFNQNDSIINVKEVYGATIILRHFWDPMISSHLTNQNANSTWYAKSKFWSPSDTIINFWIGFNNFSRSTATHPPSDQHWDEKNSQVWVNKNIIHAPKWANSIAKIDLEVPMIDENYEIREPMPIYIKKGWNDILIKCPVGSFKSENWQNPVKWMFTFIPLQN